MPITSDDMTWEQRLEAHLIEWSRRHPFTFVFLPGIVVLIILIVIDHA